MKTIQFFLLLTAYCLLPTSSNAQSDKELIQFSGLVLRSDSLMSVPYAHIIIKGLNRGTVSDYRGYFSIVLAKRDTVIFSSVGFKRTYYVIPDTLEKSRYSIVQLLTQDTIYLPETVVFPWPSPDQFRHAFLNLDIPDDDLERAKKNLEREKMKELGLTLGPDANEIGDYYSRQEAAKFYYAGQIPPMNIFNPMAWMEFFQAWKRGDFKRKK